MTELLLGYTETVGRKLTHLAPVHEGGLPDHLTIRPLCRSLIPRGRYQLGKSTGPDWKAAEATYKTAAEAVEAWEFRGGDCPKCWAKINRQAEAEAGGLVLTRPLLGKKETP